MKSRYLGFLVALVVFALDQLAKWLVTGPLGVNQVGDQLYLLPFFQLTYTQNGHGRLDTRIVDGEFALEFQNSDRFAVGINDDYEYLKSTTSIIVPTLKVPVGGYRFTTGRIGYNLGQQRPYSALMESPPVDDWVDLVQKGHVIPLSNDVIELGRKWSGIQPKAAGSYGLADLPLPIIGPVEDKYEPTRPFLAGSPKPRPVIRIVKDF